MWMGFIAALSAGSVVYIMPWVLDVNFTPCCDMDGVVIRDHFPKTVIG